MNISCRQPDHTSIAGFDSTRRYRCGTPNPQISCRLNPGRPLPGYATYPLSESVSLDRPCPDRRPQLAERAAHLEVVIAAPVQDAASLPRAARAYWKRRSLIDLDAIEYQQE
jgi:hypothetical protein